MVFIPAVLQKDELYTLHIVGHIDPKWRHNHRRVGEAKKLPSLSLRRCLVTTDHMDGADCTSKLSFELVILQKRTPNHLPRRKAPSAGSFTQQLR
jgi:hypothetical protein